MKIYIFDKIWHMHICETIATNKIINIHLISKDQMLNVFL